MSSPRSLQWNIIKEIPEIYQKLLVWMYSSFIFNWIGQIIMMLSVGVKVIHHIDKCCRVCQVFSWTRIHLTIPKCTPRPFWENNIYGLLEGISPCIIAQSWNPSSSRFVCQNFRLLGKLKSLEEYMNVCQFSDFFGWRC